MTWARAESLRCILARSCAHRQRRRHESLLQVCASMNQQWIFSSAPLGFVSSSKRSLPASLTSILNLFDGGRVIFYLGHHRDRLGSATFSPEGFGKLN